MDAETLKTLLGGGKPGTYLLELHLPERRRITIGKLGTYIFESGYYYYTGSAFGPGGVAARCKHHVNISRKPRWHIDYLRAQCTLVSIRYSLSSKHLEHRWAESLAAEASQPIEKFGASDCNCFTHLFYTLQAQSSPDINTTAYIDLTHKKSALK